MSLVQFKRKFNSILNQINGVSSTNFSTTLSAAYEALTLSSVMLEYKRLYGGIHSFTLPTHRRFLNQKPGKFRISRSFKIEFLSGASFYFATDVEVFGLEAFRLNRPVGELFEVDVVVIPEKEANLVVNQFMGYPAPQHIDSAYECKYGKYNKGQLRELLGLKRHLSYLNTGITNLTSRGLFNFSINNSNPSIPIKMVRPKRLQFLNQATANLFELQQIIVR